MRKAVIYVHGKGGSAKEAEHYKPLFEGVDVVGFDYSAKNPWEAKTEFPSFFKEVSKNYDSVSVIANSIGAFFTMSSVSGEYLETAYFISPIVDMEKLISDMMRWANVTENDLFERKEIETEFGETLSFDYLRYVRENPVDWSVPTHILYGERDNLTSYATISEFADEIGATLTVMNGGEHWFHTEEQMNFLDAWLNGAVSNALDFETTPLRVKKVLTIIRLIIRFKPNGSSIYGKFGLKQF